jgi:hypothetical protein
MAAAPTEDAETRLYVEDVGKQFVVYAEEMFAKPGPDLAREVRSSDPYAKDSTVEEVTSGGLREIWITPRDLRADHEKALALRVYVVVPDGLLVRVSFFVSPEVIPDGSGCSALASRLAKTLAAGKRTVPTSARRVALDAGRSMSLPQDFGFYAQPGPDFVVYHAYPITTLDGPEGSLHVYFGGHPEKPRGSANFTGSLLGKPTGFIDARDGEHHRREAVVQVPGSPGLFMHVFFGTSDAALFGALEKIAASIQ